MALPIDTRYYKEARIEKRGNDFVVVFQPKEAIVGLQRQIPKRVKKFKSLKKAQQSAIDSGIQVREGTSLTSYLKQNLETAKAKNPKAFMTKVEKAKDAEDTRLAREIALLRQQEEAKEAKLKAQEAEEKRQKLEDYHAIIERSGQEHKLLVAQFAENKEAIDRAYRDNNLALLKTFQRSQQDINYNQEMFKQDYQDTIRNLNESYKDSVQSYQRNFDRQADQLERQLGLQKGSILEAGGQALSQSLQQQGTAYTQSQTQLQQAGLGTSSAQDVLASQRQRQQRGRGAIRQNVLSNIQQAGLNYQTNLGYAQEDLQYGLNRAQTTLDRGQRDEFSNYQRLFGQQERLRRRTIEDYNDDIAQGRENYLNALYRKELEYRTDIYKNYTEQGNRIHDLNIVGIGDNLALRRAKLEHQRLLELYDVGRATGTPGVSRPLSLGQATKGNLGGRPRNNQRGY